MCYHVFIYPTKSTNRYSRNVEAYIKIYIKMLLHVSAQQTIIWELIFVLC